MNAIVSLMPEEQLGVVVANSLVSGLPPALAYRVFDAYLKRPAKD